MSAALRVLVRHSDQNYGPFEPQELNDLLHAGRVHPNDLAWIEGAPEWQLLRTVPGVRAVPPPPPAAPAAGPMARPAMAAAAGYVSDRLILPAFLLAFFLGVFGLHRFYCGRVGSGIAMLVLTFTGIGLLVTGIWATVDWILLACGAFQDGEGRAIRNWT